MRIPSPERNRALRIRFTHALAVVTAMIGVAHAAVAQSMNVQVGGVVPLSTCAGPAGQPGTWGSAGPSCTDLCAQPTRVASTWAGSPIDGDSVNHPSTSGCDQSLLDTFRTRFFEPPASVILTFRHLRGGTYDVYAIAWHPNGSTGGSVSVNGMRPQSVGGPWPGGFVEGITHVKKRVTIADDGGIAITVSNPVGTNLAFNAVQLVHMPDAANGDVDGDGVANGCDLCPTTPNPGMQDIDSDLVGDACQPCPWYRGHKGPEADCAFGMIVNGGVDANGDGVRDYLIAAPMKDPQACGMVYQRSGATGDPRLTIFGPGTPTAFFGTGMAVGIFVGIDGPVAVIGAPGAFGTVGTLHFHSLVIGSEVNSPIEGLGMNDEFGTTVWIGDLDVIPGSDVIGFPRNSDYIKAIFGLGGTSEFFPPGILAGMQFGRSIIDIGDVDEDGTPDLAISVPRMPMNGGTSVGKVLIVSKASLDPSSGTFTVLHQITGQSDSASSQQFGWDMVSLGDVTGDAMPDFAVGALQCSGVVCHAGPGYVRAYSGADFSLLYELVGSMESRRFGMSLDNVGDTNGDGKTDLLIGSPGDANMPGLARLVSADTGATIRTFHASAIGQAFGEDVAGLGDINGDGLNDVMIGGPSYFISGAPGFVKIYLGQPGIVSDCAIPVPCPADLATPRNGTVDTDDLLALLGSWGMCGNCADCPADIAPANRNCVVDTDDLLTLLGSWNSCP